MRIGSGLDIAPELTREWIHVRRLSRCGPHVALPGNHIGDHGWESPDPNWSFIKDTPRRQTRQRRFRGLSGGHARTRPADVAVSVTGEGRGIAPERLAHVFHRHAGLAAGGEGTAADTGLGLVICKGLVEAHGGRIRAESAGAGRGARFTFTLPAVEDARAGESAGPAVRAPAEPGEAVPVLVVDDDPQTLRFVRDALAKAGYAPLVTAEPEELARIVRTEKPRLVLLDLMLPGTDGIALMQSVPELAELPVVFISGYGRDENVARALEAGDVNLVRNFVKRLRAKLGEDASNPTWIVNVRGVGYRMAAPGEPGPGEERGLPAGP